MAFDVEDTIAAIASALGSAIRGIIRISGPGTVNCLRSVFHGLPANHLTGAFRLSTTWSLEPNRSGVPVELLIWPNHRSFTRQPSAEIHTVGSPPLLQLILKQLLETDCRLAEPGEFTMRAFLSGRLDLTQAEAILGVIDAKNEQEFDRAIEQLAGGIAGPISEFRDQTIAILAELEAGLDFVEEDIEFISAEKLRSDLQQLESNMRKLIEQIESRSSSDERIRVVFYGKPNVGKSSLFNLLTGSRAIVADQAGTTRDYLTCELEIDNVPLLLVDTAGIETDLMHSNEIDRQMQQASSDSVRHSDIAIRCIECGSSFSESKLEDSLVHSHTHTITVGTKTDIANQVPGDEHAVLTSVLDGTGIDKLRKRIVETAQSISNGETEPATTLTRTHNSLVAAAQAIHQAIVASELESGDEIIASELRISLDELGKVVGTVYTDDILDRIFGQFCIGK